MTPEQTVESIKNIAKTIREASARMRENSTNPTSKRRNLWNYRSSSWSCLRGTWYYKRFERKWSYQEIASAVEERTMVAHETVQSVRDVIRETVETAPQTAML